MLSLICLVALGASKTAAPSDSNLSVFAAVSLRESFQAIAKDFELAHPGVHVLLSFAGSQELAAQIDQGAPCDVFASADERNLGKVSYVQNSRRVIALNRLVEVVAPQTHQIGSFRNLAGYSTIILAAPAVPAGGYAQQALTSASKRYGGAWLGQLKSHVVSQEQDVRAVLAKVELGEAEAGIVYASDAAIAGSKVRVVAIPEEFQPTIYYPAAIVSTSKNAHLSREFLHAVLNPPGQRQLVSRGFVSPLTPRGFVILNMSVSHVRLTLPLSSRYPRIAVTAVGPDKKRHAYSGVPLNSILGKRATAGQITITAADEYQRTYALSDLLGNKAVLVPKNGFVQLVIPGHQPFDWVDWITAIDVR